MATVIEFPRRSPIPSTATPAPACPTLDQAIDQAALACLNLGSKFEGIVADLEKSLTILSAALNNGRSSPSPENAQKLAEIKDQLARARRLLEAVRSDLRPSQDRH
jgi:hypothetical protein